MKKIEVQTADTKHIFIDIVNYTFNRSVEAQSHLIMVLNNIVLETIEHLKVARNCIIFIPTGDGMCISLINVLNPFDIHVQIGLKLLEKIDDYNKIEKDRTRKFSIRIGINENIDNLITDINGQQNISGAGINIASRIESLADENQILIGNSVFEKLVQREKYISSFKTFTGLVKHDLSLKVHQLIYHELEYLNSEVPSRFKQKPNVKTQLSKFQGFYLANCIIHEEFINSKLGKSSVSYSLHVLFYQYTLDTIAKSETTKTHPAYTKRVENDWEEYLNKIGCLSIWLRHDFIQKIIAVELNSVKDCFEEEFLIVNEIGRKRLKEEQSAICNILKIK